MKTQCPQLRCVMGSCSSQCFIECEIRLILAASVSQMRVENVSWLTLTPDIGDNSFHSALQKVVQVERAGCSQEIIGVLQGPNATLGLLILWPESHYCIQCLSRPLRHSLSC